MNAISNHPAFIGFDNLFRQMESTMRRTDAYPPHNIIKHSEQDYSLELALAGYSVHDITVEIDQGVLTITGKKGDNEDIEYIHRGISGRAFSRSFNLAEDMVVARSFFNDGLLTVKLVKVVQEDSKPRKIDVWDGPDGSQPGATDF